MQPLQEDLASASGTLTPCSCRNNILPVISPLTTKELPEGYVEQVKHVHDSSGYSPRGYEYDWSKEEAKKNLLRYHKTAVSARMLYELAKKPFNPKRYYSIERIFRNEMAEPKFLVSILAGTVSVDVFAKNGLICNQRLTLGDLIGVQHEFFSQLGMSKLRFKPAYNPYTEPSMEILGNIFYHGGFGKWVEVGNSGMFRPEMLLPMGLPVDVRIVAWGLSLKRWILVSSRQTLYVA
ncbi:hypothetical protein RGQ29_005250 [Quercus rubra]|uniref:phenylalanine--tRNA ligase n=1 Tax=Quercus rubra TaxID=3512 RepID=A0AAN7E3S3_QUERU|nr:hypothetical protein RGQ29_005250 [Quercus rubra]